jgi:tetratricopeptide (TPR) repeat protein
VEQLSNSASSLTSGYTSQLRVYLANGDWPGLYQTVGGWLEIEPGQPVATFFKNIACLFINPPNIIQNKSYLVNVSKKEWKVVTDWFTGFWTEGEKHNPYYQALDFILKPTSKKVSSIETALQDNPNNAELLFLQAIALRDRNSSIARLKQAIYNKPEFPAALYLLGIFSLEISQVQEAEIYLNKAVEQAPNFLEAHYQLGSLYSLYIPDATEKARQHFQKVIELDPEGGAGKDARKVLEENKEPQYGQRAGRSTTARKGGLSILTIAGISLLTVVLFSGPVAQFLKITNPSIGILAGLFVFIGLYSMLGRRK